MVLTTPTSAKLTAFRTMAIRVSRAAAGPGKRDLNRSSTLMAHPLSMPVGFRRARLACAQQSHGVGLERVPAKLKRKKCLRATLVDRIFCGKPVPTLPENVLD